MIAPVRRTRGDDIDAACGQLKGQVMDRTRRQAEFRKAPGRAGSMMRCVVRTLFRSVAAVAASGCVDKPLCAHQLGKQHYVEPAVQRITNRATSAIVTCREPAA
jgi:hypothetical protein